MMLPKPRQWRCKKYGEFVRTLPCCLTGDYATEYLAIDNHHENLPGDGGRKASDERQIPVRHDLHVLMESPGHSREEVYARYGVDPEQVIAQTQELWEKKYKSRPWEGV